MCAQKVRLRLRRLILTHIEQTLPIQPVLKACTDTAELMRLTHASGLSITTACNKSQLPAPWESAIISAPFAKRGARERRTCQIRTCKIGHMGATCAPCSRHVGVILAKLFYLLVHSSSIQGLNKVCGCCILQVERYCVRAAGQCSAESPTQVQIAADQVVAMSVPAWKGTACRLCCSVATVQLHVTALC